MYKRQASEVNKFFYKSPKAKEAGKDWMKVVAGAITWEGRKNYTDVQGCEESLALIDPKLREKVEEWVKEIDGCENTSDNIELARRVYKEILEEGERRHKEGGKGDGEGEGEPDKDEPHGDEPTGGDGNIDVNPKPEGDNDGDSNETGNEQEGKNPTDEDDERSGGEGTQDTEEGVKSDGAEEEDHGVPEDTGGQEVGDGPETGEQGDRGKEKPDGDADGEGEEKATDEGGEIVNRWGHSTDDPSFGKAVERKLRELELIADVESNDYVIASTEKDCVISPKGGDPSEYTRVVNTMSSSLSVMRRKLEKSLLAKQNRGFDHGREYGRLDTKRLVSGYNGSPFVYKMKEEIPDMDTAVSILVDCSGSMSGRKIRLARDCSIAFAEALDKTQVRYEILGFTTGIHDYHYHFYGDFSRTENLVHNIFKGFDDKLINCRRDIARIVNVSLRNNVDGEAVLWARERLLKQHEKRKILFVLSDGHPEFEGRYGMSPHSHLRYTVDETIKAGVELFGIGICDKSVQLSLIHI